LYLCGANGLFQYNLFTKATKSVLPAQKAFQQNMKRLYLSPDGFLWIATDNNSVLVLKPNQTFEEISAKQGYRKTPLCFVALADNKIAIGSKEGLTILQYQVSDTANFSFSVQDITTYNGLPSNQVNALACDDSLIYMATDNGVASMPRNPPTAFHPIYLQLSKISINQRDTFLQSRYELPSGQKFILLEFAAAALAGNCNRIEYCINNSGIWEAIEERTLNITLPEGENTVQARAIDENGKANSNVLLLSFIIAKPFYKTIWFWVLLSVTITGTLFWLKNRREFLQQQRFYKMELALQAQRQLITADLHDEIGATLSSLQINSTVANHWINRDTEKAKAMLEKIENQSQQLGEKLGDFIWSMKPGKEEFVTFSSRIKTFANYIIGGTQIDYSISIDDNVDTALNKIEVRKNILLICKEAINNAVKYSEASVIDISVELLNQTFVATVTDNGKGFDPNVVKGNGLQNMQKRAEELKGKLEVKTQLGAGTKIIAIIPIP
jgi:signal transduction histidine kinase